ncbi:GPI-GlcNAc transferase complex, PIG-H component-domain-containing protein [Thamnidium elegans]|nr:GPI-GlcNAc transferase complex, PIG-H component-domain-containing protein [Thamnidium elegans]
MNKPPLTDEDNSTYTLGLMTCNILPGVKAREYIVRAPNRAIGFIDLLLWSTILYLLWCLHYKYSICILLVWLFLKRKSVRQESILAIRDVGIQVKTVYWGGSSVTRFINRLKIEDIIINEGISFWQIKSYMAILVKDEDKMVVVFENILPKLNPVLLRVYNGTRAVIFSQRLNVKSESFYSN